MQDAINQLYQTESRCVLATLIRLLGDFDLAEQLAGFTCWKRAI